MNATPHWASLVFSCLYAPFMAYGSECKQQLIRQNQQQLGSTKPSLCCQLSVHYNSHTAERSENIGIIL